MEARTLRQALSFRVAEASPRDMGKSFARLDPRDIEGLGVQTGDVVEITGKRRTVARVMPAYPEHRGKGVILIDGILRENAQVGLDENVTMKGIHSQKAASLLLVPLTPLPAKMDLQYLAHQIGEIPVVEGDRIRLTLLGSRYLDFTCKETFPKEAVVLTPSTRIHLESDEKMEQRGNRISYEDIGGLGKEIQRIREMIELPLKYPEIFERLGIEAPKGVLLHGPPGTGKTLIARAVANETDAAFFHINGPEIIHKFYGESEAKLRNIFEQASRKAPSIIFLDEIDSIASKRSDLQGEIEKRVVAQLLALMDGLEKRGQVTVIGATNIPHNLDPALRRPGRFDREICIGIPDRKGRLEILQIHSRGMPLEREVDLEKIAEVTHGFVGADLEALCRESAMLALRRIIPEINFSECDLSPEALGKLKVTMEDFMQALKEVEPSALREVMVEVPEVKWEDIGGLEEVKKKLQEAVEWPMRYRDLFVAAGATPPKGILLHGPPGTGKTLLAKAVAHETGLNFISVKGPALLSKWVGESERSIREVFKKARLSAPCIIFFDEIDSLVPRRTNSGDSRVAERVLSQFLTEMDGIEEMKDVVVLGASNRMDLIDPALLRGGRFDLLLALPLPNREARLAVLAIHNRNKPLDRDVDLEFLATVTEGLAGSDLENITRRATLSAMREFIESKRTSLEEFQIKQRHFLLALQEIHPELVRSIHGAGTTAMREDSSMQDIEPGRKLVYVEILHSSEDMGSLATALEESFISRFGHSAWVNRSQATSKLWETIRERLMALRISPQKMRLYQDGLPLCGHEQGIVRSVARCGGSNYKLLHELMQQGASLEGTEDPVLLMQEYQYLKELSQVPEALEAFHDSEPGKARELLEKRDAFIAQRISETLLPGEIGVLFIGLKHNVAAKIPHDMEVIYLLDDYSLQAGNCDASLAGGRNASTGERTHGTG